MFDSIIFAYIQFVIMLTELKKVLSGISSVYVVQYTVNCNTAVTCFDLQVKQPSVYSQNTLKNVNACE
jgi:hypothetical protein